MIPNHVKKAVHALCSTSTSVRTRSFGSATGYWLQGDFDDADVSDENVNTYGIYAGFYRFNPNVELKGIYYFQNLGDDLALGFEDSPKAWK